jgi:hypothetical protein
MLVAHTLAVPYSAVWEQLPDHSGLSMRACVGWPERGIIGATAEADTTSPIGSVLLATSPMLIADWPSETRFDLGVGDVANAADSLRTL